MTPDPSTDVQLQTHVFTSATREFGGKGRTWSPTTSTIVAGKTEAVLTDTGHIKSEVSELGDMIERTGKRRTTIYISHGHLDHFLGIGQLLERFPDARPVATAAVVADIKATVADQENSGRPGSATTSTRPASCRSRWTATCSSLRVTSCE